MMILTIYEIQIHLPVDGGYPEVVPVIAVRPLSPPIEDTEEVAEVALPKCVADPEYPP